MRPAARCREQAVGAAHPQLWCTTTVTTTTRTCTTLRRRRTRLAAWRWMQTTCLATSRRLTPCMQAWRRCCRRRHRRRRRPSSARGMGRRWTRWSCRRAGGMRWRRWRRRTGSHQPLPRRRKRWQRLWRPCARLLACHSTTAALLPRRHAPCLPPARHRRRRRHPTLPLLLTQPPAGRPARLHFRLAAACAPQLPPPVPLTAMRPHCCVRSWWAYSCTPPLHGHPLQTRTVGWLPRRRRRLHPSSRRWLPPCVPRRRAPPWHRACVACWQIAVPLARRSLRSRTAPRLPPHAALRRRCRSRRTRRYRLRHTPRRQRPPHCWLLHPPPLPLRCRSQALRAVPPA